MREGALMAAQQRTLRGGDELKCRQDGVARADTLADSWRGREIEDGVSRFGVTAQALRLLSG